MPRSKNSGVKYNERGKLFDYGDLPAFVAQSLNEGNLRGDNRGVYTYNVPVSFDIETSSFFEQGGAKKRAVMYIWQFGINGNVITGRTWEQFTVMLDYLRESLDLGENRRLIVYVHNLGFEFQFMRKWQEWEKVFAVDERKPLYCVSRGIEFRCSYLLSGYSLEEVGAHLHKYKIPKLVGNLDYSKIRHKHTALSQSELDYCINDVRVVMAYIQEYIESTKGVERIPLTKTGVVRRFCRGNCFYYTGEDLKKHVNYRYKKTIGSLRIGCNNFGMIHKSFIGGFTHANSRYVNTVLENVASYDFTSSYPYVMCAEQYPMSIGVKTVPKSSREIQEYFESGKYCVIAQIKFEDLIAADINENYISLENTLNADEKVLNNGRIVAAKTLELICTNIDFQIIKQYYKWTKCYVGTCLIYKAGYLPTPFIKSVVELYKRKTELKGIEGMEREYIAAKEMLNSCYGMCVTNPARDEIAYKMGEWTVMRRDRESEIYKHDNNANRFLFYPWGVFVTAYARRNLFTGIKAAGDDYVYSDTDSVKLTNHEKHAAYFNEYNENARRKLERAAKYHNMAADEFAPRNRDGVPKPLGAWDFEGVYRRFKTLGAKRYMVEKAGILTAGGKSYDYSLTVAGLDKRAAIPFLLKQYGSGHIFDAFRDGAYFPPEATGKRLLSYIDEDTRGVVTDYNGIKCEYHERSSLHLGDIDYTLSLADMFLQYLQGIKPQNI